jgi:Uncharacterized protein related to plant photosystem II stability/assembly factor
MASEVVVPIQVATRLGMNQAWAEVARADATGQIFAAAHGGQLYVSEDEGQSWDSIEFSVSTPARWTELSVSSDGNTLALLGDDHVIYHSTDAGETVASSHADRSVNLGRKYSRFKHGVISSAGMRVESLIHGGVSIVRENVTEDLLGDVHSISLTRSHMMVVSVSQSRSPRPLISNQFDMSTGALTHHFMVRQSPPYHHQYTTSLGLMKGQSRPSGEKLRDRSLCVQVGYRGPPERSLRARCGGHA